MSILPPNQATDVIPIEMPAECFDVDKLILKCIWKSKETRIAKTIFKKKNTLGIFTLPNFKT